MLSLFRAKGLSNIVYGVIILATVMVFVIQFRPNAGKTTASCTKHCSVTVKGYCIEPKAYNSEVALLLPRGQELPASRMAQFRDIAMKALIERELLIAEAERLGITVSDTEITDQIFSGWVRLPVPTDNPALAQQLTGGRDALLPFGFKDPKTKEFDLKVYQRTVRNAARLSEADFRDEQKRELLASKVRDLVRASIRVSDAEAYAGYVAQYDTATIEYVTVKQSYAAKYGVVVSDADVTAWMKDHQADVDKTFDERKNDNLPKEGRVRHILGQFNDSRGSRAPTAEERASALAKVSMAYARVKAGESFAAVARDTSDDPGSAKKGGGYDKEQVDGMVDAWKNAANALQPGEMTQGAVETQFGFHVLMKDAVPPEGPKADAVTEAVKKGIARELLTKERAAALAKDVAGYIAADMKAGKSADDAVAAHMGSFTPALAKGAGPAAIVPIKVLNEAQAATDAAARLSATADAGAPVAPSPTPAAGDAGVAGDASTAATPKNGKTDPLSAYKPLTAATDPDRPRAQTSAPFNKSADPPTGFSPSSLDDLMKFAFGSKDGDVLADPLPGTDGVIAVRLKEHHATSQEDFDKGRDIYLAELLTKKQAEALALYVKELRQKADKNNEIKIDKGTQEGTDGGAPAQPSDDDDQGY